MSTASARGLRLTKSRVSPLSLPAPSDRQYFESPASVNWDARVGDLFYFLKSGRLPTGVTRVALQFGYAFAAV